MVIIVGLEGGANGQSWRLRDDDADPLFASNAIMPAQYYDAPREDADFQPLRRLMLAVLEDAIATFQKTAKAGGGRDRLLFGEVQTWLQDRRDEGLFSFENICDALGIDSSRLRLALLKGERAGTRRSISWRRRPVLAHTRATPTEKGARVAEREYRSRTRNHGRRGGGPTTSSHISVARLSRRSFHQLLRAML